MDDNFWQAKKLGDQKPNFYQECKKSALNSPFFTFIKQYPRVSLILLVLLIIVILVLPISFREKVLLPLRALVIGFLLALGAFFYRVYKIKEKEYDE